MSCRLHLAAIALATALVAAAAIPVFGQRAQSLPPVPAVPAAPGKYDFQWEKFEARAAQGGKAFYLFEGQQPVGIGSLGRGGKPEIYPIVSGGAAEELRASFERFTRAKSIGATHISRTSAPLSITLAPRPATSGGGAPRVAFDADGAHVSLNGGTVVDFLAARLEVTMPAAIPDSPATRISFDSRAAGDYAGKAPGGMGITVNGKPINWQRKGPVWEGLKALVLELAVGRAGQAARIADKAPGRPAGTPDYVALVAEIEKHLN